MSRGEAHIAVAGWKKSGGMGGQRTGLSYLENQVLNMIRWACYAGQCSKRRLKREAEERGSRKP